MRATSHALDERLRSNFVGVSEASQAVLALIRRFARSRATILITGETGSGKELAAHAAHYLSDRCDAAFVPVNCGALPDSLIETELFGHAKGSFTNASRARAGLIRAAEGGTLFLDEVEALSPRGQVILLRFLQDHSFRPIGEEQTHHADVRIIAASNLNLLRLVESGGFRSDLMFRLDVLAVQMPALRERMDDIPLLVEHLLAKAARTEGGSLKAVSPAALGLLCSYPWPGNVRELEHVLLRCHLRCDGAVVEKKDLLCCCPEMSNSAGLVARMDGNELRREKLRATHEVERRFIERALAQTNGNISEAARLCNMERGAMSKMAKKHRHNRARLEGPVELVE
jgi:two-component system, NtrC family, response regulator GlrR